MAFDAIQFFLSKVDLVKFESSMMASCCSLFVFPQAMSDDWNIGHYLWGYPVVTPELWQLIVAIFENISNFDVNHCHYAQRELPIQHEKLKDSETILKTPAKFDQRFFIDKSILPTDCILRKTLQLNVALGGNPRVAQAIPLHHEIFIS